MQHNEARTPVHTVPEQLMKQSKNYPVQCEHSLSFNCEQLQAQTIRSDDGFTSSTQHRSP